jgi:YD repeat-containing protein
VTETTYFGYDPNGNMVQKTDADGQVTDFSYDGLNRETGELWYNASSALVITVAYTYDLDSELHSASDDSSSYTYTYNSLGEESSVDNNGSGPSGTTGTADVPDVVLNSTYDAAGNRLTLSATVGGTADFVNTYSSNDRKRPVEPVG